MSLLKKKNQLAPMATTATTVTITQVKGLFVVAVVAADVAEVTWVPVGAGVVWETNNPSCLILGKSLDNEKFSMR